MKWRKKQPSNGLSPCTSLSSRCLPPPSTSSEISTETPEQKPNSPQQQYLPWQPDFSLHISRQPQAHSTTSTISTSVDLTKGQGLMHEITQQGRLLCPPFLFTCNLLLLLLPSSLTLASRIQKMAISPSSSMAPSSMDHWSVIQKKVGPLLGVVVLVSAILAFLFFMSSSSGGSLLSQTISLISAPRTPSSTGVIELVQTPPDSETDGSNGSNSSTSVSDNKTSLIPAVQGFHPNASSPVQLSNDDDEIEEICDISQGKWVKEPQGSTYTNLTCPTLRDIKNCGKYGKDQRYLYWRWQPDGCDLPRFDPQAFLDIVRGKKMAIIGDSLARDHIESLLCLLSQADVPTNTFRDSIDRYLTWHFPKHNFTLMVMWTEYLVEATPRLVNGTLSSSFDLHLDRVNRRWADKLPGVDYAVLSTGNWFFRSIHLHEGGELIGCVNCWDPDLPRLSVAEAIRRALRTALVSIAACGECEGMVALLRTFTPSHFENGSWFSGGYCNKTRPLEEGEISLGDVAWEIRGMQVEEIGRARGGGKVRFGVLDVTKAMMLRADAHPGEHWSKFEGRVNDCLHWCLPGPVDIWSELLLATLRKNSRHN